jgi:hypothetical protein
LHTLFWAKDTGADLLAKYVLGRRLTIEVPSIDKTPALKPQMRWTHWTDWVEEQMRRKSMLQQIILQTGKNEKVFYQLRHLDYLFFETNAPHQDS